MDTLFLAPGATLAVKCVNEILIRGETQAHLHDATR